MAHPRMSAYGASRHFGRVVECRRSRSKAEINQAGDPLYYCGYWVYDDVADYYYWFPADYVIVDSSWVDYVA